MYTVAQAFVKAVQLQKELTLAELLGMQGLNTFLPLSCTFDSPAQGIHDARTKSHL